MKNMLIILSLFTSIMFAETTEESSTNDSNQISMGFDFHMFPWQFNTDDPGSSADENQSGFYLSADSNNLRYELFTGYTSNVSEVDYDSNLLDDFNLTRSWTTFKLGIFYKVQQSDKIFSYLGLRIGKILYDWEIDSDGIGQDDDGEEEITIISPAFGVEYYISDYFSFGAEIELSNTTSEQKIEDDWYYGDSDITTTNMQIIPKFIVRFYF